MRKTLVLLTAALLAIGIANGAAAHSNHGKKHGHAAKGGHYDGTAGANTVDVDVSDDGKTATFTYLCATDTAGTPTVLTAKIKGSQFKFRKREAAASASAKGGHKGGKKVVTEYVHGTFVSKDRVKGQVLIRSCSAKKLKWSATRATGPTGATGSTGATGGTGATGPTV